MESLRILPEFSHQISVSENRRALRKACTAQIRVVWAHGEELGVIEDRSGNGFGIRLKKALPVGAAVQILHFDQRYSAMVRHCSEANGEYLIGVRLLERL